MGLPRQDVEFRACDGIVLRGFLYAQEETSPCIIMTHGVSILKLPLLYPWWYSPFPTTTICGGFSRRRQADYYDAFNYASSLPFVDKDKIVYWGTSFSGGNVIHAAAVDKRIKAAIIQCPAVSGETRSIAFKDRIPTLLEDRRQITSGSEPPTIPLVAADRESADPAKTNAMFPTKDAYDVINLQNDCGSRWGNFITSQTQLHMLLFEGQAMIHRISPTPLLFVVPGNDVLVKTEYQMDAFNKASEPKQLLYLDGCGHFDLYVGDYFKQNIKAQIEFLDRHVKSQSS
ncbi:hypothetical protein FPRO03_07053 [Fusarium proliferatum]|nr:hypothetical protein FPRO03_07053 [Fusarium proliferatum]